MKGGIALVLACLLGCALASCGKKAEPSPPGPAGAVIYPKSYPPPP